MSALEEAVEEMADLFERTGDAPELWGGFQCTEIEALARVLAIAGRPEVGAEIIMQHGRADDDGYDLHHAIYVQNQRLEEAREELRRAQA